MSGIALTQVQHLLFGLVEPRHPLAPNLPLGAAAELQACGWAARAVRGSAAVGPGTWGGERREEPETSPALLVKGGIAVPQPHQTSQRPREEAVGTAAGRGGDGSRGVDGNTKYIVSNTETLYIYDLFSTLYKFIS